MKVLITGFEPFQKEKLNPSCEILKQLPDKFEKIVLPVSYKRSFAGLEKLLQQNDYDHIFMLGQAGGREKICLEKVAMNFVGAKIPDEDGQYLEDQLIDPTAPQSFISNQPIEAWIENLPKDKVMISQSAGSFVCNYLYFKTLYWLALNRKTTHAVFIHLPWMPQQNKTPHMSLDEMAQIFLKILN
jgi:pyroglutamyl-peptidase